MINKRLSVPAFLVFVTLIITGCSSDKKQTSEIPDQLKQEPHKVVKHLISDLQFNYIEKAVLYFSSNIPQDTINKLATVFVERRSIGKYEADIISPIPITDDSSEATVELIFSYRNNEQTTGIRKKIVEKTAVVLKNENGLWKIRTVGIPEFDEIIEEGVFNNCLNTIMDASLAQEKSRFKTDSYSSTIADLLKVYSFDEMSCDELNVEWADKDHYLIVARSKNTNPCEIKVDNNPVYNEETDSYSPSFSPVSYEECKATQHAPE